MNFEQQLIAEIESQLEDDVLYFGWLVQIARQQNPTYTESECADVVLDSIARLHRDGTIVVGNARETDGMVLIDAWPELNHDLRDRMESVIAESKNRDRDICFWIQLTKHFAR